MIGLLAKKRMKNTLESSMPRLQPFIKSIKEKGRLNG